MKQPFNVVMSDDGFYEIEGDHGPEQESNPAYEASPVGARGVSEECLRLNLLHHTKKNASALMELYAAYGADSFHYDKQSDKALRIDRLLYKRGTRADRFMYTLELPHTLKYYIDRGLLESVPGCMRNNLRLVAAVAWEVSRMRWTESTVSRAISVWCESV